MQEGAKINLHRDKAYHENNTKNDFRTKTRALKRVIYDFSPPSGFSEELGDIVDDILSLEVSSPKTVNFSFFSSSFRSSE